MSGLFCSILSLLFIGFPQSQEKLDVEYIDSLEREMIYAENQQKLIILDELSALYFNLALDKSNEYSAELLRLAKQMEDKGKLANAYIYLGNINFQRAHFQEALNYFDSSLVVARSVQDTLATIKSLVNLGMANFRANSIEKAQQYFLYSINLCEQSEAKTCLAEAYFQIGSYYWEISQNKRAENYLNNAYQLFEKNSDLKGLQKVLNLLAFIDLKADRVEEAKNKVFRSLEIGMSINDKLNLGHSLMLMGEVYFKEGLYLNAHNFLRQAIAKNSEVGIENGYLYLLLGKVNYSLNRSASVESYFNKAIEIERRNKRFLFINLIYSDLYKFYENRGDFERSYGYLSSLILIEDSLNNLFSLGKNLERQILFETNLLKEEIDALSNEQQRISDVFALSRKKTALQRTIKIVTSVFFILFSVLLVFFISYFRKRKLLHDQISERNQDIANQREMLFKQTRMLRENNKELEKLSLVARVTENAVIIVQPNGVIEWINDGFKSLYGYDLEEIKLLLGDNIFHKESQYNIKDVLIDCILKKKTISKVFSFETKYAKIIWIKSSLTPIYDEFGDLYKVIIIESDITNIKQAEQEIVYQRNEIQHQWERMKIQKEEIENQIAIVTNQKKGIVDSILYARRIQNAIFPQKAFIKSILEDVFVLHRPKDIVSGDFFWIKEKNNKIVIAVGDASMQGVPGALLSLLGILFVDSIVENAKKDTASEYIDQLNQSVYNAINTSDDFSISTNGLDVSVVVYDKMTQKIQFTGAKQAISIVRNGELFVLQGDQKELGKEAGRNIGFNEQEFQAQVGDMLYLYSDGYQKQFFVDPFVNNRFAEFNKLLTEISSLDLEEQKKALNYKLRHFYRGVAQIDDALVIGLKL